MFSEERIDTFFLIGRRRSAAWDFFFFLSLAIVGQLVSSVINMQRFGFRNSERLFAEVVASTRAAGGGGLGALAPTPPAASAASAGVATAPEVAAATTVVLRDLGGREPEARPDLGGDDLDDVAPVAIAVLVAALLEAAGDDDARALRERLAHVLGHLAPAHDVEEARRFLPFVGVAVHPASVQRHAEARVGRAARRVAKLGIAGQVAHDGDRVAVRHWCFLPMRPPRRRSLSSGARRPALESGAPCGGIPRQPGRAPGATPASPAARPSPGAPRSSPPCDG